MFDKHIYDKLLEVLCSKNCLMFDKHTCIFDELPKELCLQYIKEWKTKCYSLLYNLLQKFILMKLL